MRISHRHKVMIYLMVLVASITWVTTHLSIIGQEFSENYQRGKFLEHRLEDVGGNLVSGLENNLDARFLSRGAQSLKGSKSEKAFIIDQEGNNLTAEKMSDADREIMDLIPIIPKIGGGEEEGALDYLKSQFLGISEPLAVKINDRIMLVYAEGRQYSVSLDVLRPDDDQSKVEWYFVTIKPNSKDAIQYLFQDAPILAMFGLALLLSVIFARFMQHEVMSTLSRIIDSSKKIEEGDLSEPPPIMADDEFGELAVHHLRMVSSVRSMIRQLGAGASQTDSTAARIREQTEEMARGSEAQSIAVEETSATIAQMNQTIGAIAESVDTLASSAEESSAAIIEMSATNDEVANSSEQLSEAVEESTASIQEMSASIREVADNVRNAAGKTGEVAHSMRNLREAVKEVDQIAAQSSEVSIQVTRDAETGMSSVNSTITGINQIWEEARNASDVIEKLSKRAREIGRILTVIEDVTEETNLLALNAAIIAAQAGEHGRGFAVVADEIKDLAERTQASTAEIAEQIQAVQSDANNAVRMVSSTEESVSKGVLLSEEAGEALQKILDSSKLSMEMAKNISDSTKKQSRAGRADTQLLRERGLHDRPDQQRHPGAVPRLRPDNKGLGKNARHRRPGQEGNPRASPGKPADQPGHRAYHPYLLLYQLVPRRTEKGRAAGPCRDHQDRRHRQRQCGRSRTNHGVRQQPQGPGRGIQAHDRRVPGRLRDRGAGRMKRPEH